MHKVVFTFHSSTTVSCPSNYNQLLSCGILNVQTSGPHDRKRYAYPISSRTCRCRTREYAKCVAWCTDAVLSYRIVTSSWVSGRSYASAYCPTGYKVSLCTNVYWRKWRLIYCYDNDVMIIMACNDRPTVYIRLFQSLDLLYLFCVFCRRFNLLVSFFCFSSAVINSNLLHDFTPNCRFY